MRRLITSALLALLLTTSISATTEAATAHPASVTVNGIPLTTQEGWIEEGISYVTLRGLDRAMEGTTLRWDGTRAIFSGEGFTLVARPGAPYIEVNDRAIYLPQGVQVPDGITVLPLRLVADGLEGTAVWREDSGVAELTTGQPDATAHSYDQTDLDWLSAVISAESRGESLEGQVAVGNVVLNRVSHWRYPDSIYGVIFDTNYGVQFEPVANGTIYNAPTDQCVIAAKLVLEGADVAGDCLYFFAPALSEGTWIRGNTQYVMTIGCHQFYRDYLI